MGYDGQDVVIFFKTGDSSVDEKLSGYGLAKTKIITALNEKCEKRKESDF